MNAFARTFAAALAGTFAVSSAEAGILGFGTREAPFSPGATGSAVPLRDNNATTVAFRTVRDNTLVAVTYNAECAAVSGVVGDHIKLWIVVDGRPQPQEFSFCSAMVVDKRVRVAASRRAVVRVPTAGLHTVRVFAYLSDGTTAGELDDSSIVIED